VHYWKRERQLRQSPSEQNVWGTHSAKGVARLQFKRRQKGQLGAERGEVWRGSASPPGRVLGRGLDPSPEILLLFDLKMEHFGAVFKLDLTEETRTQLQEGEAVASSCLILATPMYSTQFPCDISPNTVNIICTCQRGNEHCCGYVWLYLLTLSYIHVYHFRVNTALVWPITVTSSVVMLLLANYGHISGT